MEREFTFDDIKTFHTWHLILTAKSITPPTVKTNYVNIGGMSGTIDLSEALTGEPTYNDRTISAKFWTNEGNRQSRERLLREITTTLHGRKIKVIEPDDPDHYFIGRASIKSVNNILPYAEFTIDIVCEPWRYSITDTHRSVSVNSATPVNIVISNSGIKTVCPTIIVVGAVTVKYDDVVLEFGDGTYKSSSIKFKHDISTVSISGNGTVTFTYREADL